MAPETRVRFAPSPTGALHIGGARAALYNWLVARQSGGALVLRIEDTDRERSTPENVEQILDALRWLEIDWDEGPISQVERSGRHREVLDDLLARGLAYRTTATAEDVKAYKLEHGDAAGYRGEPSADGEGAVRLRVPDGDLVVRDIVRGDTTFQGRHLDEPVIARADLTALYNFAVAVDDHDAGITHVIRGEDHLSNTPKQLLVYAALGAEPPAFAHLPLLHGHDGKKLSKRHGAASVQELRAAGYLPAAIRNYIALLGWGDLDSETLITTDELVTRFDLARVTRNPARFDEQKLRWMNGRYLRELSPEQLTDELERFTGREGLAAGVAISAEKIQTLADFWPLAGFLYDGPVEDPKAREKWLSSPEHLAALAGARAALEAVEPFDVAHIDTALRAVAAAREVKPKDVFQPVRVAIAGTAASPGLFESLDVLGRESSLARLDAVLSNPG
ncbi:MAG: glutamyl-tRNA synthetase [Solirubrobacterales bacterium]|jgi:glutamyl-tRNA synthetase|nr:glutamyl-tRNA synthetase [Solirubrobacterales bacterium]